MNRQPAVARSARSTGCTRSASRLARLSVIALLLPALLLTGCGDDGDETPPSGGTRPAQEEAPALASLDGLDSFRYTISVRIDIPRLEDQLTEGFAALLSNVDITGSSQPPDKTEWRMTLGENGQERGAVVIGDRSWFLSQGTWAESSAAPVETSLLSPEKIVGELANPPAFAGKKPEREDVDGVAALHYSATEDSFELFALFLGIGEAGGDFSGRTKTDLWLTEEGGYPVRVVIDAASKGGEDEEMSVHLEMRVSDLNDPTIQISPPAP